MSLIKLIGFISIVLNIFLILSILLRSPDEQSVQETLGSSSLFISSRQAENFIDRLIQVLVFFYFVFGLLINLRYFS